MTKALTITPKHANSNEYLLASPFNFRYRTVTYTVPEQFCFDGASVPSLFWSIVGHPFSPRFVTAALVHDFLYKEKPLQRKEADEIFKGYLRRSGVARWRAYAMHAAVRLFGWMAW